MNKSKYLLIALLSTVSVAFYSCKEDEEPIVETPTVQFNFTNPIPGSMYSKGDTVFIDGMISFENGLHGYEVSIVNKSHNDTVVFNKHGHDHNTMFHIHDYWVNSVMHHSDMELQIEALTEHGGGKSETKTIKFHCHPM